MHTALGKKNTVSGLWRSALDVLLPPRCLGTGEIVDAPGMLSPAFWAQLKFIENPFCHTCGIPFSFAVSGEMLCASCIDIEPVFDRARSAVIYDDASRKAILAFKYGDRLHAVHTFTPWMLRAGKDLIDSADLIVPVPLHNRRLRERRFNQSGLLAQELAARSFRVYVPDVLLRTRHTPPQQGLNYKERGKNVRGAFNINQKYENSIEGKTILLVDDVFTSGATLNECARVLKKAGVATVNVLTIARVMRDEF